MSMCLLNLGCGSHFHPDWVNLDLRSTNSNVIEYDIGKGIPYPDMTFDVVYHSHLLEHFKKDEALGLMRECYRVLKTRGVIRVVVPDLEQIAKMYLDTLENASINQDQWKYNYDWIMLELYDQAVRLCPGGAMLEFLKQDSLPNTDFVLSRVGIEAKRIFQAKRVKKNLNTNKKSSLKKLLFGILRSYSSLREKFYKKILGEEDYKNLQVGRFRASGEIHQWMYDRYSLARLLTAAGFQNPVQKNANESIIDKWVTFNLDTEPDGSVYKPDSLYMEAKKPQHENP